MPTNNSIYGFRIKNINRKNIHKFRIKKRNRLNGKKKSTLRRNKNKHNRLKISTQIKFKPIRKIKNKKVSFKTNNINNYFKNTKIFHSLPPKRALKQFHNQSFKNIFSSHVPLHRIKIKIINPKKEIFDPKYEMTGDYVKYENNEFKDNKFKNNDSENNDSENKTSISKISEIYPWPEFLKPVYVISIRRNRMDGFVKRMGSWIRHMKRFPCTDGRFLSPQKMIKDNQYNPVIGLTKGQLGAAQSHIGVWKSIVKSPHDYATILEDDVQFANNERGYKILKNISKSMKELKQSGKPWDFISWSHGPLAEKKNKKVPGLKYWKKPGKCQGFFAYTIKKSLVEKLLKSVYPLKRAIDVWLFNLSMKNYIQAWTIHPNQFYVIPGPSETTKLRA